MLTHDILITPLTVEKPLLIFSSAPTAVQTRQQYSSHEHAATPKLADAEGERRIRRLLEDTAGRNATLLNDLMATMGAVSAMRNNETKLSQLEAELSAQNTVVSEAVDSSKARFKKHKSYRDSVLKKWYYFLTKMRYKFDEKAMHEEKVYYEALKEQSTKEEREKQLQQDLVRVQKEGAEYAVIAKKHEDTHKQIDDLYHYIFAGPTPGFPDEDEREATYAQRKQEHDQATETLKAVVKASRLVAGVGSAIELARTQNTRAEEEVKSSIRSFERAFLWLERCARILERGVQLEKEGLDTFPVPQDQDLVHAHQSLEHHLGFAKKYARAAIRYDKPSRANMTSSLQTIYGSLDRTSSVQQDIAHLLKDQEDCARESIKATARALEDSRQALQEIRQGAFEFTVGFGATAPAYHECCERAEAYEVDAEEECQRVVVSSVDDIEGMPAAPKYRPDDRGE